MIRLALIALLLTGCAKHPVASVPGIPRGVDVVCPDPPPLHPDVLVGSTPCVFRGK